MRKRKKGRKFSMKIGQRKALMRILGSNLISKEKIKTTQAKAKELSFYIEKQITRAKKGNIFARRLLARNFPPKIVKKMVDEIAPKYKERKGGYTRVIKLGQRASDGAKMAIIELVK